MSAVTTPPEALASRMRVCQIMSADLWAGAEVQVATSAAYLVGRRDVELSAVLLNDGPLAGELRRLGVPVTVMDESRRGSASLLIALTRWLRHHPVDIVHTHRCKDTVLGAVAARLAGVPGVIRTIHGEAEPLRGWARLRYRIYDGLDAWTLRLSADRIVAVSRRLAGRLEGSGFGPETVLPIHNGVDLSRVHASRSRDEVRGALGIAPDALLFGTVGRLSPVKGQALFVRAAGRIRHRHPGARFLIAGDGPLRGELEAAARALGLGDAFLFLGARRDVYDLVAALDVFVLPSLHEGIPMALLEAMALGTPVVATAVGGVPELLTHRETGLLVDAGDHEGLADACVELARDPRQRRRLAARARRAVEAGFSHEHNGQALVQAYREVAARSRAGRHALVHAAAAIARLGRRRVRTAVLAADRRRMERVRRDPARLKAALGRARQVLVVCHGNIYRSAFAARLLAQAVADGGASVVSGGLAAVTGAPAPPAAVSVAARFGVDLRGHAASPVTAAVVAASDVVFVMEVGQLRDLRRRFPGAREKVYLLGCLAPEWPLEVRDPYGRDTSVLQGCFEQILACVRPIVRALGDEAAA